ncbi:DUF3325 domain-containing protein [Sphingopyxis sp. R3-92]|uniref:DUF3325 domain-containing protein n=1 Tax=Sphingopyxis sp. R3-92 TaxID=3158553 RepID=UPI003EE80BD9
MTHLLLLFLATLGFGLLCLSRERHQRDLIDRKLAKKTMKYARWIGASLLALAFLLAGNRLGWAVGTLEWLGLSSSGALMTMIILSRRSRRVSSRR